MKILANDGLAQSGISALENAGFEVVVTKVAQEQLQNFINDEGIDALIITKNTTIHPELLEACPSIKLIAHQGTNLDHIDVEFAADNGIHVIHSADGTANAIAELVFAHLLGMARFLPQANREMPLEGELRFNALKKEFSEGIELRGKTLGIIGDTADAEQVASLALGMGMNVIFSGDYSEEKSIAVLFYNGQQIDIQVATEPYAEVLKQADFLTLHIENQDSHLITQEHFEHMKDGVGIVNTAAGGLIDEVALVNAIESGKVRFAGLDVFESQPRPEIQLLMNTDLSLTPNIATLTQEAKTKSGSDLSKQIIALLAE